jgi:hypothetical protein
MAATITPWAALMVARSRVERSVGMDLNLYGFLRWVERADFYESLALSTGILAHPAGCRAFFPALLREGAPGTVSL